MSLSAKRNAKSVKNIRREDAAKQAEFVSAKHIRIYEGLRDERGSVTRFEKHGGNMPSRLYMEDYLAAGGRLDSMCVWGWSLEKLAVAQAEYSAAFMAEVAALFGRCDFINLKTCLALAAEGKPLTRRNYVLWEKGAARRQILELFGIFVPNDNIGLGWWPPEKSMRVLSERASKPVNAATANQMLWDAATANQMLWDAVEYLPSEGSHQWRKFISDLAKYEARKTRSYFGINPSAAPFAVFSKIAALKYANYSRGHYGGANWQYVTGAKIADSVTFKGEQIHLGGGKVIVCRKWKSAYMQARRIGENFAVKIGETVFMWPVSGRFSDHVEGASVKDCLSKLAARTRLKNYEICLEQVRNDVRGTASFCLAGVKRFASDRMPFLYRLIADYKSWSEIPTDIMRATFHLSGPEVFAGFPNPVTR